jgi:peptidoglycan/xylan/chitin deacetylase (PgdA/CDA1 family)
MRSLNEAGYSCVTCAELLRQIRTSTHRAKTIAITFDDGYLDNVTTAAPIMAEFGFAATIFIVSGLIGATAEWDARYGGAMAQLADRQQIRSLHEMGWEIGHHTITHAGLTRLSDDEINHEVLHGHRHLEASLGIPVDSFAYPFSMQDARVRERMIDTPFAEIYAAGHEPVTRASPREAVPRVFVLRDQSVEDLHSMIETGYAVNQSTN